MNKTVITRHCEEVAVATDEALLRRSEATASQRRAIPSHSTGLLYSTGLLRSLCSLAMTVFGLLFVFFMTGCGQKAGEERSPVDEVEVEKRPVVETAIDPATVGAVRGRVFYSGPAPERREIPIKGNPECAVLHKGGKVLSEELMVRDGLLQSVFVYVKEGLEGRAFNRSLEAAVIENKHCVYVPHVTGAQVGQPVVLLNSDPTLHNVHSYSKNQPAWNLGLPFQGMKQTRKFSSPEVMVILKCDVHPWMIGYVGVLSHPYFSVSGEDGGFEIKGLPPGEYVVEAWHEKLGVQSQKIKIGPRETKEMEFKF